jgi:hypothetical protein
MNVGVAKLTFDWSYVLTSVWHSWSPNGSKLGPAEIG